MPHILIQHEVEDFATWKEAYDSRTDVHDAAGFKELQILQGLDNPNNIVILFFNPNIERAREYLNSDDLKQAMEGAGVIGAPQIIELQ
ncbi:hypothetical protein OAF75_04225 [Verrucomicrobiales bacterium]|nr:hypothetical protein [Verrucomicrobiales bacterium]|tara:strand:- start:911 stop:1174 length:264 start_codon:yes stop_codon:yes gene_type:complete